MANNDPMQIDVTLQATEPLNVSLGEMYKGGDGSFAGLSDVALDNPTNGQVPKYNSETEKWENADDNTVSNLTDLEDVNISNPTDGQIVRYDAETDKFIASDEQVGDSVSVTQSLAQGTKVGEISVDGQTTELFAPTPASPTEVTVTQVQSTGTKIATIGVDGVETDLFAPEGGGGASSADQVSVDDTNLAYEADDVQEALEKITKRLTYAEYKALTDAEKNNGTIYLITDVNGDGQSFQPVIYSTEEREIGVYIDGKPLYCKVLVNSSTVTANNISWTTIPLNNQPENIDKFVFGALLADAYPVSYEQPRIIYDSANTVFKMASVQNSSYVAGRLLIYAEYTKTTDTPGSGTWTPQGVPAHHYSTDEQVIGTWVDGKTLYQKTIYNAGGTNGVWSFSHNIGNLEMITEANGGCIVHGYSDYSQISWQTLPRTSPDSANIGIVGISDSFISMYVNDAFGNRVTDIYITLRYTKTST